MMSHIRNDPSNAPAWLLNVALAPWDQVHMTVKDGLACICPGIDTDVEGRH
jgi:hypothetical protein